MTIEHGNDVQIMWYPPVSPTPILEYLLEVGSASGASDIGVFSMGTSTSLRVRRVPPGTYFVRVRPRNAFGWGQASPDRMVTTTAARLVGPAHLNVAVEGRRVVLIWSPPFEGDVVFYEVLVASTPEATNAAVIFNVGLAIPVFFGSHRQIIFSNVPTGNYYVRVRAVTTAGLTESSNEVQARVCPEIPDLFAHPDCFPR